MKFDDFRELKLKKNSPSERFLKYTMRIQFEDEDSNSKRELSEFS